MEEIWKDISGYEGIYQVSSLGNVRSLDRLSVNGRKLKGKKLRPYTDTGGYSQVKLYSMNHGKGLFIHRLVAIAFIDNPYNKPEVNHIDEDKSNNHVSNLEWMTRVENVNYGDRNNKVFKKLKNRRDLSKVVRCSNGIIYPSITEASRKLKLSQPDISKHLQGILKSVKGYTFELVGDK